MAIIFIASVSVYFIVKQAVEQATSIIDRLNLQNGTLDINAITNAANQASESSGSVWGNAALLLIVVCWIVGIVDAYAIGKAMDSK